MLRSREYLFGACCNRRWAIILFIDYIPRRLPGSVAFDTRRDGTSQRCRTIRGNLRRIPDPAAVCVPSWKCSAPPRRDLMALKKSPGGLKAARADAAQSMPHTRGRALDLAKDGQQSPAFYVFLSYLLSIMKVILHPTPRASLPLVRSGERLELSGGDTEPTTFSGCARRHSRSVRPRSAGTRESPRSARHGQRKTSSRTRRLEGNEKGKEKEDERKGEERPRASRPNNETSAMPLSFLRNPRDFSIHSREYANEPRRGSSRMWRAKTKTLFVSRA